MNRLIRYFDLASEQRSRGAVSRSADGQPLHWFWQYLALVLGIIVQPFLAAYQQLGHWQLTGLPGRTLFALLVGLVVFPGVYKNAFDPGKPIFVQFCAIFAAGMGWESLLRTAVKAAGG